MVCSPFKNIMYLNTFFKFVLSKSLLEDNKKKVWAVKQRSKTSIWIRSAINLGVSTSLKWLVSCWTTSQPWWPIPLAHDNQIQQTKIHMLYRRGEKKLTDLNAEQKMVQLLKNVNRYFLFVHVCIYIIVHCFHIQCLVEPSVTGCLYTTNRHTCNDHECRFHCGHSFI